MQLQIEEQEMKVIDQENIIRELESALEHVKLQCDRRLTLQHKEHEKKLQLILHHFKGICFLWGGLYSKYCLQSVLGNTIFQLKKNPVRFRDVFWMSLILMLCRMLRNRHMVSVWMEK